MKLFYNYIPTTCFAKKNQQYSYSSVQIPLPNDIAKQIINWGKNNINDTDVYEKENKYGRENEIHVTAKYGLITNNISEIKEIIKNFKPFNITLNNVTFFRNNDKDYDVCKIEISSPKLKQLHNTLSKLDNEDEHPIYNPHCTIAYINKNTCKELENNPEFKGISIKITELEFSPTIGKKQKIKL